MQEQIIGHGSRMLLTARLFEHVAGFLPEPHGRSDQVLRNPSQGRVIQL